MITKSGDRLLAVWLAIALLAAAAAEAAPTLHFERIGTESGPPPDVITAIFQDSAGLVWIGSRDGLTMYDGHAFRVFEHDASDPRSISDHSVRTIYEDRGGNLWIGTNTGGLNRLDRASWTFEHFRHDSTDPGSISHDSVYAILEDRTGALWVGTQVGINRLDRATGVFARMLADPSDPGSISNDYIMALHENRAGRIWVGTLGGGLNLWNPETESFTAFRNDPDDPQSLGHDRVSSIAEDSSGKMWVGTLHGLSLLLDPDQGRFRNFDHDPSDPASLSDELVTSVEPGLPGKLWVGTHGGGLNELDVASGRFRAWRHDPQRRSSLGDDEILALWVDRSGALWIGTWGGGLNRLTRTSLLLDSLSVVPCGPAELASQDVTALLRDRRGGMWIGTRGGSVFRTDPGSGTSRRLVAGAPDGVGRIILGFAEDPQGNLWVGTNGDLLRIDATNERVASYSHDPGDPASLGAGYVKALLVDRSGRLWIGTGEGGVQRLDSEGRVIARFRHDPADAGSLSDDYVTTLLEDRFGVLWVGTRSGGLNALDPDTGRARRFLPDPEEENSLSYHSVTSMFEDSSGRLWVGTSGGGVNRVDRPADGGYRFARFTEKHGLIDNDVMAILEDRDGSLWLSTKRGLSRFEPDGESFFSIHVSDGLPTAEFEAGAAAASPEALCFGTVKGLVTIPAGTPFTPPEPSPTVITSLRTPAGDVSGQLPLWNVEALEIPWGEWLSIEMAVLDYSPERRNMYAYRLDDDWVELGARREITFSSLAPGIHEFSARGRNSQGVWSDPTPSLTIDVIPPFWMTPWFRSVVVLSVVGLAVVGHRVRMKAVNKRNQELVALYEQREKARDELGRAYQRLRQLTRRLEAAKEEERRHIARELHDEMGPALTAVIINLQLLAESPGPARASGRIADTIEVVDRLVERIRDLSLDLRPPLLDELGLMPALRGYLEVQAERSGVAIEVLGDTASGGLPPELEIAAFRVVQEAVTNVIRHSGASRATVTISRSDGNLQLVVKDDGRGFDVRATLDGGAGRALGLLGMQERVGMLGGEVQIEAARGKGTVVRARIPVGLET